MATKHTKQMYVVVECDNSILWFTLSELEDDSTYKAMSNRGSSWKQLKSHGYTVQPVTVTIELNTKQDDRDKTES